MGREILLILLIAAILAGCARNMTYGEAVAKINDINAKYNSTMESYPASAEQVKEMLSEFGSLNGTKIQSKQEQFDYALGYRILSLEAANLYLEGTKYGSLATTKDGFSCRPRPLIIESAGLRNKSVSKSYEAVSVLWMFLDKHPDDASDLGLSSRTAIFQNGTALRVFEDANRDIRIINSFCPQNRTLEIYREYLKGRGNYSDDFINNLSYDEAVKIWRKIRGYN